MSREEMSEKAAHILPSPDTEWKNTKKPMQQVRMICQGAAIRFWTCSEHSAQK